MTSTVSVGQFATMTHLSVKTLRHYHEVGLLEPAQVDAATGYRRYRLDQLPTAQLIRRLRALKMPVADVGRLLVAQDPEQRNVLISAHLQRLEADLDDTRAAVNSLRALLDAGRTRAPIIRRPAPALETISITSAVDPSELLPWWEGALDELRTFARQQNLDPSGPAGGIFDEAIYRQERAAATVYLPIDADVAPTGRVRPLHLPAAELATTTHHGASADIDLAYADLGGYLAEHGLYVDDRIHERYLRGHLDTPDQTQWETEIAWPIRNS